MSINKKILIEHFHGRSTPLEKNMIEEWLKDSENIETYFEYLDEWERQNLQFITTNEFAFKKTIQLLETNSAPSVKTSNRNVYQFLYSKLSVAAVLLIMIITGLYFNKDRILYKTVRTSFGEINSFLLPDGSRVSLNSNSMLQYPRFGFGLKAREVLLSGEAYFSVQHTATNQKFLVKTNNDLTITVLGTQFTVYDRHQVSKVILNNGKVELKYKENSVEKKLIMLPGDFYTAEKDSRTLSHISNPESLSTWKYHVFSFESTSMLEVAKLLKDSFGLNVHFETPGISENKITGSLKAENAKELISAISELLEIQYSIEGDTISLYK